MELTDPNSGQIKTSVLVIGSVGVLGVLFLLGRGSSSNASPSVVSGGQSSGISDQLGQVSDAVANLAANQPTGSDTSGTNASPTASDTTAFQSWLTQVLAASGNPYRDNPTNPLSPVSYTPSTAYVNNPGGVVHPGVDGVVASGGIAAYSHYLQPYVNPTQAVAPQNPLPADATSARLAAIPKLQGYITNLQSVANPTTAQKSELATYQQRLVDYRSSLS